MWNLYYVKDQISTMSTRTHAAFVPCLNSSDKTVNSSRNAHSALSHNHEDQARRAVDVPELTIYAEQELKKQSQILTL